MPKEIEFYGVMQSVDTLYVNFFTDRASAEAWVVSENRMGDEVIGPIPLEVPSSVETPFKIILGVNAGEMLQAVYFKPEGESFTLEDPTKHAELLGPYTVYENIGEFRRLEESD